MLKVHPRPAPRARPAPASPRRGLVWSRVVSCGLVWSRVVAWSRVVSCGLACRVRPAARTHAPPCRRQVGAEHADDVLFAIGVEEGREAAVDASMPWTAEKILEDEQRVKDVFADSDDE